MAKKIVAPEQLSTALTDILGDSKKRSLKTVNKIYRAAGIRIFSDVIHDTPVDEGRLRGNWFLSTGSPSKKKTKSAKNRGTLYIAKTFPVDALGERIFLTNNLPYASVVEYGRYPNPAKRGSYDRKSKSYVINTVGGYSNQAPAGMMRKNAKNFGRFVKLLARKNSGSF